MRLRTNKLLLCGAIAITMLVGTNADARRRAGQGDEGLVDATAEGPKGMGFLDVSITNLSAQVGVVSGEISATLRLRVKGKLAVFLTKIPRTKVGDGFGDTFIDEVNGLIIRNRILDALRGDTGRPGGIVADFFFPGAGFAATVKVLDESVACEIDEIFLDEPTVVHCPPDPNPPLRLVPLEINYVQDVTIAFTAP